MVCAAPQGQSHPQSTAGAVQYATSHISGNSWAVKHLVTCTVRSCFFISQLLALVVAAHLLWQLQFHLLSIDTLTIHGQISIAQSVKQWIALQKSGIALPGLVRDAIP
jgi:hypothetical protein